MNIAIISNSIKNCENEMRMYEGVDDEKYKVAKALRDSLKLLLLESYKF